MSVQIDLTYQSGDTFLCPIQTHIAKLSNGNLVAFYIKQTTSSTTTRYNCYYAISTNNGVSWGTPASVRNTTFFFDIYQIGDNFIFGRQSSSSGACTAQLLSYNSETNTFSVGTSYNATSYSTDDYPVKLVKYNNKYWLFACRKGYQPIYGSYCDTIDDTWTTISSANTGAQPVSLDVAVLSNKLLVFAVHSSKVYMSEITGEYSWGSWAEVCATISDITSISSYVVSDTEIYLSVRTTSGLKIYLYNGSSWGSATNISSQENDKCGRFSVINGILIFSYLYENADGDKWGLAYHIKGGSGWSTATNIVELSSTQLHAYTTIPVSSTDTLYYNIVSGASAPFVVASDSVTIEIPITALTADDTVTVSDTSLFKPSMVRSTFDEDAVVVSDAFTLQPSGIKFTDSVLISDNAVFLAIPKAEISADETVTVTDALSFLVHKQTSLSDNVVVSDSLTATPLYKINNPLKVLSYNPLIVITDTTPRKIFRIDTSDVDNITWEAEEITETNDINNFYYNATNGYIYVLCDNGEIKKILATDFTVQTIIATGDLDNLEFGTLLSSSLRTFAVTDDADGEIVLLDERTTKTFPLDITFLQSMEHPIDLNVQTVSGKSFPLDVTFLENATKAIGLDIRFNKYDWSVASPIPIDYTNVQVKINGVDLVPLNDVDMTSIVINHYETEDSTATFVLHRRFDNLDKTLANTSSVITQNNEVKIYIAGHLEFTGKINNLTVNSETETVTVSAKGEVSQTDARTIDIALSTLGQPLGLYDCLVTNIQIDNPYIDPLDENPEYYKGVEVDLGIYREQNILRFDSFHNVVDEIKAGTFQPDEGWSYFWFVSVLRVFKSLFGSTPSVTNAQYIGTSMMSTSAEDIYLQSAMYKYQRQYSDIEHTIGYYRLGEAPYLSISAPNGVYKTKDRWEDRPNGLYRVKDESYNFIPVAKQHARVEYEKLKNINGDILPIVTADFQITIDAYYYYALKIASKINVTNTTEVGIYKNKNGFPVGVKGITISIGAGTVVLQTSNQKSATELEELEDSKISEESYVIEEKAVLNFRKYDIVKGEISSDVDWNEGNIGNLELTRLDLG